MASPNSSVSLRGLGTLPPDAPGRVGSRTPGARPAAFHPKESEPSPAAPDQQRLKDLIGPYWVPIWDSLGHSTSLGTTELDRRIGRGMGEAGAERGVFSGSDLNQGIDEKPAE